MTDLFTLEFCQQRKHSGAATARRGAARRGAVDDEQTFLDKPTRIREYVVKGWVSALSRDGQEIGGEHCNTPGLHPTPRQPITQGNTEVTKPKEPTTLWFGSSYETGHTYRDCVRGPKLRAHEDSMVVDALGAGPVMFRQAHDDSGRHYAVCVVCSRRSEKEARGNA